LVFVFNSYLFGFKQGNLGIMAEEKRVLDVKRMPMMGG